MLVLSVRTYQLKNSNIDSYDQVGSDIVGETAGSQFGFAVSVSGDGSVFVVGARYNDGNGRNAGEVPSSTTSSIQPLAVTL